MNGRQAAHLSGQAVQMNLGNGHGMPQHQQLQVASGHRGVDPEFLSMRKTMHQRIVETIAQKHAASGRSNMVLLAKRFEEVMFRKHPTKDDYYEMLKGPINAALNDAIATTAVQARRSLELLVHASTCFTPGCQYPDCVRVKGLFCHTRKCQIRASGGCKLCQETWGLLQLHARACKESECRVPRCRDVKELLRRLQQQSESRRRAAADVSSQDS